MTNGRNARPLGAQRDPQGVGPPALVGTRRYYPKHCSLYLSLIIAAKRESRMMSECEKTKREGGRRKGGAN